RAHQRRRGAACLAHDRAPLVVGDVEYGRGVAQRCDGDLLAALGVRLVQVCDDRGRAPQLDARGRGPRGDERAHGTVGRRCHGRASRSIVTSLSTGGSAGRSHAKRRVGTSPARRGTTWTCTCGTSWKLAVPLFW